MSIPDDLSAPTHRLLAGLRTALTAARADWADLPLVPLPDSGLAHAHVRIVGSGALARVPKQSQMGLPPAANLAHQQACFERAQPGRHTPRLLGALPVSAALPRGALLVEEIDGRAPTLPAALAAIARALAALHALPLPPPAQRAPLADPPDPLAALHAEIAQQARHVAAAGLAPPVQASIAQGLQDLAAQAGTARPPRCLVSFDAHPGNFLMAGARAVLVDLEKCRYSHAGLDLAHASLYTSTTWDVATRAALTPQEVADFYAAWEVAAGPALAEGARGWHLPLRRAMWLWSLTWCCKWRVESGRPPRAPAAGEDWSAAHSDAALIAHVRERVDHYLSPEGVAFVEQELQQLAAWWGNGCG